MEPNWGPTMDTSDWRTQLQPGSREKIIDKIMDTLKRNLPVSGQDGLNELYKIAQRFEKKIYTAAESQGNYLWTISLKLLTMDNKTHNTMVNPMQSNAGGPSSRPIDSGIPMQSQVHNPAQSHAIPVPNQNQQANNVQQSTQPMLQQHSQSVTRQQQQQTSINDQQQTSISQQPLLAPQQQQHLLALQSNVTSMQHPQLLERQNDVVDMQQHLRLLAGQQNNLPTLQHQQQLINQQNNLANMHQQQLGSNVFGLQQQVLATQSGNSSLQTNQHSSNTLQQSNVPVQQQSQQNVTNLSQFQGLHSQSQVPQQQLTPQIQSQPAQLQQQLGLQQRPNPLQQNMQQRLLASSSLLQRQNVLLDQQNRLYQSQRDLPNSSSTSQASTTQTRKPEEDDWKEEVYQKIKSMKESYLPELTEMLQKIAVKLLVHEPLPCQAKSEQLEKLKIFKTMLERLIGFLQVSKGQIVPSFKEKMASYEKQIINFINTNRPRKAMASMQQGQLPPPHMPPVSQSESQLNQVNSQMQSTNFQSFVATMPQSFGANLSSSSVNSLQQVGVSSLRQNSLNAPQQQNVLDQQKQSYQSQRTFHDSSSSSPGSTALTGKSGGDDRQEEVYQKKKNVRKSPEPPQEPVFNCPICMDPLVEEMSTRCGHIFCKSCIKAAINAQGKCPTCRKKANVKELIRVFLPSAS